MLNKYKTAGILGGMGPLATVKLFQLIVRLTEAEGDREHIPLIISSEPDIPDRTAAAISNGESPVGYLIERAKKLESCGVQFIGMPCITAHCFIDEVKTTVKVPFLNLVELTRDYITNLEAAYEKIVVLSTEGTLKTGLLSEHFSGLPGRIFIYPDREEQEILNKIIFGRDGVKGGNLEKSSAGMVELGDHYTRKGANALVAGCTELAVLLEEESGKLKVINPLYILARAIIAEAGGKISAQRV